MSIVAFSGMFALLFFGPLILGGKNRHGRHGSDEDSLAGSIIKWVVENPEMVIAICCVGVIVMNIYLLVKNTKNKYIVGIDLENDTLFFKITDLYFKNIEKVSISVSSVTFTIINKTSDMEGKTQSLRFNDIRTDELIGMIKPRHVIWSDQFNDVRRACKKLSEIGVVGIKKNGKSSSTVGDLFKPR